MKNGQGNNDKALKEILKLIIVFYQKALKKKMGRGHIECEETIYAALVHIYA